MVSLRKAQRAECHRYELSTHPVLPFLQALSEAVTICRKAQADRDGNQDLSRHISKIR